MNSFYVNIKGKAHNGTNSECEDAIYINEKNGVFCVADGVSNSRYGKKGAECLVNNLGKAFASSDYKKYLRDAEPNSIRKKICNDFNKLLDKLCEEFMCGDTNLFASTFIALIMTGNKEATIIHAGDGTVFAKPSGSQCAGACILSYPDNSESGSVYSAGHPEQKDRIRVLRIRTSDYSKIILSTDGFSDAYLIPSYQAFDADSLSCVFAANSADDIKAIIKKKHFAERNITDDISCVVCSFDDSLDIKSNDNLHGTSQLTEKENNNKINSTNNHGHSNAETTSLTPIVKTSSGAKLKKTGINIPFKVMCLLIIVALVITSAFLLHERKGINDKIKSQENEICLLNDRLDGFEEKVQNLEDEIDTIKAKSKTDVESSNEETSEVDSADESGSDSLINENTETQNSLG